MGKAGLGQSQKSGITCWSPILVADLRTQVLGPFIYFFPQHTSRKHDSQEWDGHSNTGCKHPQQQLSPLYHDTCPQAEFLSVEHLAPPMKESIVQATCNSPLGTCGSHSGTPRQWVCSVSDLPSKCKVEEMTSPVATVTPKAVVPCG